MKMILILKPLAVLTPPNYLKPTSFIDSAASISLGGQKALYKIAAVQEKNKSLGIPNGVSMSTTQTVELLLPKLSIAARKAHRLLSTSRNLVAISKLCDAGCIVYFHKHGVAIKYEGEIIDRGWQDRATCLWQVPLNSKDTKIGSPQKHHHLSMIQATAWYSIWR